MLFGDDPSGLYLNPCFDPKNINSKKGWSYTEIAEIVWRELKHQKPLKKNEIIEEITHGWFPGRKDYDYDENYNEKIRKDAEECYEKFRKDAPKGSKVFSFTYGDDYGDLFAAMEHGDLFRRFKHLRISHH